MRPLFKKSAKYFESEDTDFFATSAYGLPVRSSRRSRNEGGCEKFGIERLIFI
jgi:hypothetical protein